MKIKSFIYLDNNKMYSLSSQLFEGITQYILREKADTVEEEHSQKGELLSGKLMADMIMQKDAKSEMKYLHDFAFNLFEQELVTRGLLYDVTNKTSIEDLRDKGIVRIKGKIIFEDFEKILLSDPSSMDYPFDSLFRNDFFCGLCPPEVKSDDGNMRCFREFPPSGHAVPRMIVQ